MEPRGDEGSGVVFHIHLRNDIKREIQGSIQIMEKEEPSGEN